MPKYNITVEGYLWFRKTRERGKGLRGFLMKKGMFELHKDEERIKKEEKTHPYDMMPKYRRGCFPKQKAY